jgi:hypothetical protein
MRLCFRAFEAVKLMTSGASPSLKCREPFSVQRYREADCAPGMYAPCYLASATPLVRPRLAKRSCQRHLGGQPDVGGPNGVMNFRADDEGSIPFTRSTFPPNG